VTLKLHNTLTGTKDVFEPLQPGHVGMYTCGPTVWNFAHVGNLRAFLFYDLLRRHLLASGYRVTHVMNVTDIDDRILDQAMHAGTTITEYVKPFIAAFFEDMRALRAQPVEHYPRATEHIPEMVAMISTLLERGYAYAAEGDVYFRIDSFPRYGELSHLDRSGLRAGARVATDKYDKESVSDFALWKKAQPGDEELGAAWDAPFGRGRPGWHIECSAMSKRYLGDTFDIHSGGIDLLFPHHTHYRQRIRLSAEALHASAEQVRRVREFSERVHRTRPAESDDADLIRRIGEVRAAYREALDDDLNLPQGVGHVFELIREANAALDETRVGADGRQALLALIEEVDGHIDVLGGEEPGLAEEVERLIAEREEARRAKDFARADRIREELRQRGIALEDSRDGVRWRRVLPEKAG
jgi:cysteinyl-tRNA synthetase